MKKGSWKNSRNSHLDLKSLGEILEHRTKKMSQKVFVGTDSHRGRDKKNRWMVVATAICLWNENCSYQGGWYCFRREYLPKVKFNGLYSRLLYEVQESLEVASYIRDVLKISVEEIHVNASLLESEMSSKYANQLRGMVEAHGFVCVLKPDDWASGAVADKHAH